MEYRKKKQPERSWPHCLLLLMAFNKKPGWKEDKCRLAQGLVTELLKEWKSLTRILPMIYNLNTLA